MASTKVADIIVPEIFNPYLIQETTRKNAFINSGIATSDSSVVISEGGKTVNIPFFKRVTATPELLSDTGSLTVNKITSDKDIAAIHARGVAFGSNDLAKLFSGADPMQAIASQLAEVWATEFQDVALATLKGVFGVAGMAESVNDQSANVLTADIMADSMFLLGDSYNKITAVAFHSAVLAKLKKLDIVEYIPPSELSLGYYSYMEKRVIVDDSLLPDAEGVYPVYFFTSGALAYNENYTLTSVETDRDILAGEDVLTSRRVFTMHPRGIRWVGTPAGETPSNTELATASNWNLVEDRKNVGIALLKVRVNPKAGTGA